MLAESITTRSSVVPGIVEEAEADANGTESSSSDLLITEESLDKVLTNLDEFNLAQRRRRPTETATFSRR